MMAEDAGEGTDVRDFDLDLTVQPAGSLYRRVDHVRMVGGTNHHDTRPLLHALEQFQEQVDDLRPVLDVFASQTPPVRDAVQFVDEQDTGRHLPRPRKGILDRLQRAGEIA